MIPVIVILSSLIVTVSLLGGLAPLTWMLNHTRLQAYLSFSAGCMLGAVFFHMLPEAARLGSPETSWWAALGLMSLFFLERFFSFHQHEACIGDVPDMAEGPPVLEQLNQSVLNQPHVHHGQDCLKVDGSRSEAAATATVESQKDGHPLSWGTATFGLAVHSLVGGVALASAVAADYADRKALGGAGWGVFLATLIHKPADALTIVALMLRSGSPRGFVHLINLAFALMIPIGVILFLVGLGNLSPHTARTMTSAALSFSAGTFLCISLSDLLPELQFHSHDRFKLSLSLLSGLGLMAGASFLESLHFP